jgi:hypothetical protein
MEAPAPVFRRFYYDADGNRVKQVGPDGTRTVYVGLWYEESGTASGGSESMSSMGGDSPLSTNETRYLPGEPVRLTLAQCHAYDQSAPFKVYHIGDEQEDLIYAAPSEPISPTVTACFN